MHPLPFTQDQLLPNEPAAAALPHRSAEQPGGTAATGHLQPPQQLGPVTGVLRGPLAHPVTELRHRPGYDAEALEAHLSG